MKKEKLLVGNIFPTSLIRRPCRIDPISIDRARALMAHCGYESFWGHSNTVSLASQILGVDLTPKTDRPAVTLTADNIPSLDGNTSSLVIVLSPDYRPGFRPAVGTEVQPSDILGWQCLAVAFGEVE